MKKWCSKCQKIIMEPHPSSGYNFAKYWRDNQCYICGTFLNIIQETNESTSYKNNRNDNNQNESRRRDRINRIQFEINKKQSQISDLHVQISTKNSQLDYMYEEYERKRAANPRLYDHQGAYPSGLDIIPEEIQKMELQIYTFEKEISSLERELNSI